MRNTKTEEEEELKRLHDEIFMLGRLSHPNIVRCLGATQHEGHINIFIEWMAGGSLDQVLHDFGLFAESVICNYTRQIIYGIVYLHEKGIIHRDLKGRFVIQSYLECAIHILYRFQLLECKYIYCTGFSYYCFSATQVYMMYV